MSIAAQLRKPALLVAAAAAIAVSFAPVAASAVEPAFGYQGSAFGTSVTAAGGVVTSGRTAPVTFGCGTPAGFFKSATSAGVDVSPLLTSGTTVSTGRTDDSPTETRTSSTVEDIGLLGGLLGGLVTADAVQSVSTVRSVNGQLATSAGGTSFTNLRVLGLPISANVAPNTTIVLPLVGFVVINEQRAVVNANSASLTVNALRVQVTQFNLLGFPVGTTIIVASAASALNAPTGGFLGGFAYGTTVGAAGGLLNSSPTFLITLPCQGTNGQVLQNTGAGISIPLVLNSGTILNTVQGSTTATTADGEATARVDSVDLLSGLVTATGIQSVATASRAAGSTTLSSEGSTFATVNVAGSPLVVADIEPNTRINLLGVGTLYLNRVIQTATAIEVRAIEIVITSPTLGLPIGAVVRVAVANASAR